MLLVADGQPRRGQLTPPWICLVAVLTVQAKAAAST
jgi:hypothetical protein